MSTTIELPEDLAVSLEQRSQEEHMTQNEVVRRALTSYLALRLPSFEPRAARPTGHWPELENILGLWRNPDNDDLVESWDGLDSLAYQRRIRREWE